MASERDGLLERVQDLALIAQSDCSCWLRIVGWPTCSSHMPPATHPRAPSPTHNASAHPCPHMPTAQVLEAREQVEETDDPAVLSEILSRNRRQQADVVSRLSAAFAADDTVQAASCTTQLTYLVRLEQELLKKLPMPAGAG